MRIVQKYGGSAVASLERIDAVAEHIRETHARGEQVAVVVSAMGKETDRLAQLAKQVNPDCDHREYDVLVSSGEQVSAALLSLALQKLGVDAQSLLAYQIGILTDEHHSRARIRQLDPQSILEHLDAGRVAVIAGFQGVTQRKALTTLGRGGSDLTAVAVASAIRAQRCELYKDVAGVYTGDPVVCRDVQHIERISYEEMMEVASSGAKVLHARAVSLAKTCNIPIEVRSYHHPQQPGTLVTREDSEMEKSVVSAVTLDQNEAKIGIARLPDQPGTAAQIFSALAEENIFVDMIVQNTFANDSTALSFTVPRDQADEAFGIIEKLAEFESWEGLHKMTNVAKVSAVGVGMRTNSGVASLMFRALAQEGVNIQAIGTSEIRISCLVDEKYGELAVRTLHEVFGLASTPA